MYEQIIKQPKDTVKVFGLALLYFCSSILMFLAVSNLTAATFMVLD